MALSGKTSSGRSWKQAAGGKKIGMAWRRQNLRRGGGGFWRVSVNSGQHRRKAKKMYQRPHCLLRSCGWLAAKAWLTVQCQLSAKIAGGWKPGVWREKHHCEAASKASAWRRSVSEASGCKTRIKISEKRQQREKYLAGWNESNVLKLNVHRKYRHVCVWNGVASQRNNLPLVIGYSVEKILEIQSEVSYYLLTYETRVINVKKAMPSYDSGRLWSSMQKKLCLLLMKGSLNASFRRREMAINVPWEERKSICDGCVCHSARNVWKRLCRESEALQKRSSEKWKYIRE